MQQEEQTFDSESAQGGINRRKALKYGIHSTALSALGTFLPKVSPAKHPTLKKVFPKRGKVVVVGAGAFGGWTALHMMRKGFDVTLVDQYGPGNSQASSGGETRLTRAYYDDPIYFTMALRSMDLWRENEQLMGQKVLHQNGLLLFNYAAETRETKAAVPIYQKAGLPLERLSVEDACKRWPQIGTKDLDHVMYDPTAGYLEARKGCKAVCDLFMKEGGVFLQQQVKPIAVKGSKLSSVTLSDGTKLEADTFVFACGPWLIRLFPELLSKLIVTRALCFFFASPPGQVDLMENKLPTWMDRDLDGPFRSFGVPGSDYRGFKVGLTPPGADNNITNRFDTYHRQVQPYEFEYALKVLALRFPKMVGQPLIEQRVCQYTSTPDNDFILDKHPQAHNVWMMGGDSGHGYKQGAGFGEIAAKMIGGETGIIDKFSLKRLV